MRGCSCAGGFSGIRGADQTACGMCEPEREYHIGRTSITTYFKCSMSPCWNWIHKNTDSKANTQLTMRCVCLTPVVMQSDATVETWSWEHACTHGRACVRGQGSGRCRNTRCAALGSASGECSDLWLAKYQQIACQSPDWSRLNKYSKISNNCVSFESNRIASNYSIRFEISNIRTSLLKNKHTYTHVV